MGKPVQVMFVLAESPAPHAAKFCHRDQHRYAPLSCRFFLRSTTSCSCRSLICFIRLGSAPLRSIGGKLAKLPPLFLNRASTRKDNSTITLDFCVSCSWRAALSVFATLSSPAVFCSWALSRSASAVATGSVLPCWAASIARLQRSICWLYFWIAFSATSRE